MSDLFGSESEAERNPYMTSVYKNPPPPTTRPFSTNRSPNPFNQDQGTRHVRNNSRLGTYSRISEPDMKRFNTQASSDLIAAATEAMPLQQSRPRARLLEGGRHADTPDRYGSAQKMSKSAKRRHSMREPSNELSEGDDEDDYFPAHKRRYMSTPRKTERRFVDTRREEQVDSNDRDREEEEALERLLARRAARENEGPNTPMNGTLYPNSPYSADTLNKKPKGKSVPLDLSQCDAADRMMWRWKSVSRPWEEIREEYGRLSGFKPAASSLSVRYIKLCENLATNGYKNDTDGSVIEPSPVRSRSKTHAKTKPPIQEVALVKAVVEAKAKTAQAFWNEVVVQMKAITGEDFAGSSLRKRYEEVEKKQFYLNEQDPAKDSVWGPVPPAWKNPRRKMKPSLRGLGDFTADEAGDGDVVGHAHGAGKGSRSMATDIQDGYMSTGERMGSTNGFGSASAAANGTHRRSDGLVPIKADEDNIGQDSLRAMLEKENESPSHAHPQASFRDANGNGSSFSQHLTSDSSTLTNVIPSTPTPATAVGAALSGMGLGNGNSSAAKTHIGLVGYGDSDEDSS